MSFRTGFPVSFLASFLRSSPTSFQRSFQRSVWMRHKGIERPRDRVAGDLRNLRNLWMTSVSVLLTPAGRVICGICVICGCSGSRVGRSGPCPTVHPCSSVVSPVKQGTVMGGDTSTERRGDASRMCLRRLLGAVQSQFSARAPVSLGVKTGLWSWFGVQSGRSSAAGLRPLSCGAPG